jgi:hypothetical protein
MVFQVTLSDSEAASVRGAAILAKMTPEEYIRAATLMYMRAARDPYWQDVK